MKNITTLACLLCWTVAAVGDDRVDKLIEKLASPRFADREKAAKELIAIGPPALGALKEAAKSRDQEVARRAEECIPVIRRNYQIGKHVAALKRDDPKERVKAAEAISKFGVDAEMAFPALIELLGDGNEEVRRAATAALSNGGPKAVEQVEAAIKHKRVGVRVEAVRFLEFTGDAPPLIAALKDESPLVRRVAASSLRLHQREASVVVPALSRAIEDKDAEVRVRAATSLLDYQVDHAPLVDLLLSSLNSDEPGVVLEAVNSLSWVGPRRKEALPVLIKLLKSGNEEIRRCAARALDDMGKQAKPAVPALMEALKDKDHRRSHAAIASALGKFGRDAQDAVPALVELLRSEDEHDRRCAVDALGKLRSGAKVAVPALIEVLSNEDQTLREAAAYALGNFGPAAAEAIPALEKCASLARRIPREEMVQIAAEGAILRIQGKR